MPARPRVGLITRPRVGLKTAILRVFFMDYTEQELEEAKAYLRDRLRNEQSMTADVQRLLEMYAAYLLTALFGHASENDIELLIHDLIEQLIADCELLAVDTHDRKSMILLYMHGERNGDTLEGRVHKRVHTFYNELFAVYTAGMLLGRGYKELLATVKKSFEKPWENPVLVEAREMQERGEIDPDYAFSEPHYGRGVAVSSLTALDTMLRYAVGDAWMYYGWLDAAERGAKGYHVLRGSSYPCDLCDSHTGIFYHIEDEENRPPYHAHCVCFMVYSYTERL